VVFGWLPVGLFFLNSARCCLLVFKKKLYPLLPVGFFLKLCPFLPERKSCGGKDETSE